MRLIDAHAIPWRLSDDLELYVTKEAIIDLPTVDAVPVVHCKDCEYSCKDANGRTCEGYWYELSEFAVAVQDDDFCSHGKRKEDA